MEVDPQEENSLRRRDEAGHEDSWKQGVSARKQQRGKAKQENHSKANRVEDCMPYVFRIAELAFVHA